MLNTHSDERLAAPWRESAARLTHLLESTADQELRLAVLKQLNRRFGDYGYPGFLKLLLVISESTNADAVALGLRRGDTPSGVLASWGATDVMCTTQRRQLDPIEYLTAWFSQRTHRPFLGEPTYRECLIRLLKLFISSALAGTEGSFAHQTRQRLGILADAWKQEHSASDIARAVSTCSIATRYWAYRA